MIQISFRIQGITFIPTTAQLHHVGDKDQRTTRYIIVREQRQSARIRNIWWTVFIYCKDGALCPTTGRCSVSTLNISHPHNADTRRATIFFSVTMLVVACTVAREVSARWESSCTVAREVSARWESSCTVAREASARWESKCKMHGKCQHAENLNAQLHGKCQHAENPNAQLHGKCQHADSRLHAKKYTKLKLTYIFDN